MAVILKIIKSCKILIQTKGKKTAVILCLFVKSVQSVCKRIFGTQIKRIERILHR